MRTAHFERELPRSHDAPWLARRALSDWFGARFASVEELHLAKLLTSELVTNAILHGRGRITLSARLGGDRLMIEVADEGEGFQYGSGRRGFDGDRGRGLLIVEAESAGWGIRDGASHVWFELPVSISPAPA